MIKEIKKEEDFNTLLVKEKLMDVAVELDCDYDIVVSINYKDIKKIVTILEEYYNEHGMKSCFVKRMYDFINKLREESILYHFQFDVNYIIYQLDIYKDMLRAEDDLEFTVLSDMNDIYGKKEDKVYEGRKCYQKLRNIRRQYIGQHH